MSLRLISPGHYLCIVLERISVREARGGDDGQQERSQSNHISK